MLVSGEPLAAKPARIVAGHEPEKTNELLQAIAKCCLNKVCLIRRLHNTPTQTENTHSSNEIFQFIYYSQFVLLLRRPKYSYGTA